MTEGDSQAGILIEADNWRIFKEGILTLYFSNSYMVFQYKIISIVLGYNCLENMNTVLVLEHII